MRFWQLKILEHIFVCYLKISEWLMGAGLLKFFIDQQEYFEIVLDCPKNIIHSCNFSLLSLMIDNRSVIIGKSIIDDYVQVLKKQLLLALANKLQLDASIQQDIGLYWNQELNEEDPSSILNYGINGNSWVGNKYFLWGTDSSKKYEQFGTWLYNNAQGDIIFEVTPVYPETFIDPMNIDEIQDYEQWMQNEYKPFLVRIIPKNIAMQWLEQIELILQKIRLNVAEIKTNDERSC